MTKNSRSKKCAMLCAGGTGGHLFPAHALASELVRRGYEIHLVADKRIERFAGDFPATARHMVPSATLSLRSPIKFLGALYALLKGYLAARRLISQVRPDVVVGFGGYPTVPPLLAAATKGVPTLIHEANAVLGRANRFLSSKVRVIAVGFSSALNKNSRTVVTGNPVRDQVIEAAKMPYQASNENEPFLLTVFGGSQGAQFFSSMIPQAVALLPDDLRVRLKIVQQTRDDDFGVVKLGYEAMGLDAEVATFFDDMPARIAQSHLVICRSGASSVAELAVIGRPALLVPYPFALDHDQAANAEALSKGGGGWVKVQEEITAQWLSDEIARLMRAPSLLAEAAEKARQSGEPEAALLLANAADLLVEGRKVTQNLIKEGLEGPQMGKNVS